MSLSVSVAGWLLLATAVAAEGMGNRSYFVHFNERQPDTPSTIWGDCMVDTRSFMRPYPYDCYSHDFVDSWGEFQHFFREISGDLRFTFDFVLYDKNFPFAKENQLWYLIAFLKELRTLVPDPNNIVAKGKTEGDLESFRGALEARVAPVRKEYEALMERLQQAKELAQRYTRKRHPVHRRSHVPYRTGARAASAYNIITTRHLDNEKRAYHGKNTVLIKP